jgi:nucleotide-binding universal stress UspA family protein
MTAIWYGPAVHAIVEQHWIHRVEGIVMTTHDRSGPGRLLLRKVAESVLRGTTTPILVAHAQGSTL